jgi:hypothetical protein
LHSFKAPKKEDVKPFFKKTGIPFSKRRVKMAKKPMTKAQIVSRLAEKFEISKKSSGMIIEEMTALAISETKKTGSSTLFLGLGAGPGEEESSYGP